MKKILFAIFGMFALLNLFAQSPASFNFQAVARDAGGIVMANTAVQTEIKIWQGVPSGTLVFSETHAVTTNNFGLINLQVGSINTTQMATIDWSNGPFYLEVLLDGNTMSTTQLLSVPYAMHANTAETITGTITETDPIFAASPASGITGTDVSNWNNKLDTEVDGSVTNELQVLSISNDTIRLTDGGFVKLPAGFSGNYSDLNGAPANVSAFTNDVGYLTTFTETDPEVGINTTNYISKWDGLSLVSSIIFDDGTNVGIGTATPNEQLEITGNLKLPYSTTTTGIIKVGADRFIYNYGIGNTFVGIRAGTLSSSGTYNSAFGNEALTSNTEGGANTAIGCQALFNNSSGIHNIAVGFKALYSNTTAFYNTAIGNQALYSNISGMDNVAIGYVALKENVSGRSNSAYGNRSLTNNINGTDNTAVGYRSLYSNTSGCYNIAIGMGSLEENIDGDKNTALGMYAGGTNSSGNGNVFLGYRAGLFETGSEKLYIANDYTSTPLIYGDFSTATLTIYSNLNINNAYAFPNLDGTSGQILSTNGTGLLGWHSLATVATSGFYNDLTGRPTNISAFTNDAGYLTTEVDGSVTNELQILSISNDTIRLSDGGFVKLPAGFSGNYNDLTGAPTNVSTFTNDAGYLTSFTEVDPKIGTNTSGYSPKWDGTNLVTGSIYQDATGKVGIGTTTPSYPLEVIGNAKVDGQLNINSVNFTSPNWTYFGFLNGNSFLYNNGNNVQMYRIGAIYSSTTALNFYNQTKVVFNAGNVGIGSSDPSTKLDVNGVVTATGGNSTLWNTAYGWGNHAAVGYLTSFTEKDTMVWKKNSSNIFFNTGNVGIGTSSPTSMLHVKGGNPGQPGKIKVEDFDNTGLSSLELTNNAGSTFYFYKLGSGYPANGRFTQGVSMIEGNHANGLAISEVTGDIHFYTGGNNERLTIKNSGNVGIGTTTPSEKLEVNGNVKVNGNIYSPGMVVQTIVKTSELPSLLNVTTYTEANTDYRVNFTPKFNNSIILVEFSFPINTDMASNTVFDMQLIRDIGGTEVLVGVGPVSGSRQQVSFVGRPGNGTDGNDRMTVNMTAKDSGLIPGTSYTYGFKYRRETGGSGTCYFNSSKLDSTVFGFSGIMTMKITEIAQ